MRYAPGRVGLFLEALFWLAVARLFLLRTPFRQTAQSFGLVLETTATEPSPGPAVRGENAGQIGWAVRAASRRAVWESKCLAQALAAGMMLRRRQIPGRLYLGVRMPARAGDPMTAHAWLRVDDAILTGEAGHERYTVVACFRTFAAAGK